MVPVSSNSNVEWIIFYDNEETFSNLDGNPEDAPREGAIVVALKDAETGRRLLWNQDTYCWEDNSWVPHDQERCNRYRRITKWPIWVEGYWRDNNFFWKIHKRALKDERLPIKTAYSNREQNTEKEWGRYGNERE